MLEEERNRAFRHVLQVGAVVGITFAIVAMSFLCGDVRQLDKRVADLETRAAATDEGVQSKRGD